MNLNEFECQVLTGEITDFEPYFKDQYNKDQREQRYILAKNGIETDRVAEMDGYNTIVDIINDGLLKERYNNWKHHPRAGVRQALVDNGYFYDYFINDEDRYIRQNIIEKDLRLGLKRLDNDEDRDVVRGELELQTNDEIELDILKAYLEAEKEYGDIEEIDELFVYSALKLKYEALTTVPTTVEKTMTPAQLYASNNPLWAHGYTANRIRRIMIQLQDKPKTEESLNSILEETAAWLEFVNKANSAK
jgi:hypothetical protein